MASLTQFTKNLNDAYLKDGGKGSSFVRNLAAQVKVTPTTIHKLLDGSEPSLELAVAISAALGFSLKTMIGDEAPVAAPPRTPTDEEFLAALIKRYDLKPKMKEALLAILEMDEIAIDSRLPSILSGKRRRAASDNKKSSAG